MTLPNNNGTWTKMLELILLNSIYTSKYFSLQEGKVWYSGENT